MPLEIKDLIGIGNICGGGKLYVTTFAIVYVSLIFSLTILLHGGCHQWRRNCQPIVLMSLFFLSLYFYFLLPLRHLQAFVKLSFIYFCLILFISVSFCFYFKTIFYIFVFNIFHLVTLHALVLIYSVNSCKNNGWQGKVIDF